MPELKRNFLKGKMNKDLDERLVPNGEYRDASNIEISTSEGSNVGSAQTILGNKSASSTTLSNQAITVGSYVDEQNEYIYNFVHKASNFNGIGEGTRSDAIIRYKKDALQDSVTSEVVLVDAYETRLVPTAAGGTYDNEVGVKPNDGSTVASSNQIYGIPKELIAVFSPPGTPNDGNYYQAKGIKPGMRVQAIDSSGVDLWGSNDVRVTRATGATNGFAVLITPVVGYASGYGDGDDYQEYYGPQMIADGVKLRFTADRFLNFKEGTVETEQNNKKADRTDAYSSAQYTPNNNIITSINTIGGLLYWTDGRNEPKKINIANCIQGSKWSENTFISGSKLYIPQLDEIKHYIKESNITVIKPAPTKPPTIKVKNGRDGITKSFIKRRLSNGPALNFALYNPTTGVFPIGHIFDQPFGTDLPNVNWQVGDLLTLTGQTYSHTATIKLIGQSQYAGFFQIELVSIDPTYANNEGGEQWIAELVQEEQSIYKDSFISFAYRYKYTDGETSVISPYSAPVFSPSKYDYDPKEGFNLGMENKINSIEICDFVPNDIPDDVVEVEVLYRDNNSANQVVSVERINIDDTKATTPGSGSNKGYLKIDSEIFGATLPSDQVDRNEDNVPTSAVSQEITASRLMYGNYTEAYDLKNGNNDIKLNINTTLFNVPTAISQVLEFSENAFESTISEPVENAANATAIYNIKFPFNLEISDEGDNFSTTNNNYTVPVSGKYSFDLSALWKGVNEVNGDWGSSQLRYFIPARLKLMKTPSGGSETEITSANSGSDAIINSVEADGGYSTGTFTTTADPGYDHIELTANYTNIELDADDVIHVVVEVEDISTMPTVQYIDYTNGQELVTTTATSFVNTTSHEASVSSATFKCTSAPVSSTTDVVKKGQKSIKTSRTYNVGVVYRDAYNRQSTVLVDDSQKINSLTEDINNIKRLGISIKNQAPDWATHYKFFVKENTGRYYNLVASAFYDNNDETHAWIAFNSVDIDKIQKEEYLILKNGHGNQTAVTVPGVKWKVLDISESVPNDGSADQSLIIETSDGVGKFFVKIAVDTNFNTYIGTNFDSLGPSTHGAVFETEPKKVQQDEKTGLYWEASKAYPIRLDEKNAESYIKVGMKVEYYNSISTVTDAEVEAIKSQFEGEDVLVEQVVGAKTFNKLLIDTQNEISNNLNAYCRVKVNKTSNLTNIITPSPGGIVFKFTDLSDGTFVTARLGKSSYNTDSLFLVPYTCPVPDFTYDNRITIPWYNCINFLNGVESDTIKDDFNADSIFEYLPSGKSSGLKASVFYEDYKKEYKVNDIIFSQIFNEKTNYNRFNEFLVAKPIVKQLNPEYGSIQRLLTRDSDLIAFCEDKVVKVLANKDALFNADGNLQIVSSDSKVLGQAIPFRGDYGISKNPESLATDEYRVYFADKARGSVLRLSNDGLTVISDYGMKDWFFDNMKPAQAMIGSFDGKKDEYNLTIHSVTNPESKKNVYTVSFAEDVNGWSSFKSFIKESGVTLNNFYYTFKNGDPYLHHVESVSRNNFYGLQFDSSVKPIFNDSPGLVKDFKTINYEGTKSKVKANTDSRDLGYYNISAEAGWYVKSLSTDLQEAEVFEFIEKEGKWFNKIVGKTTSSASGLDTKEFPVQGIGVISAAITIDSGSIDGYNFNVTVNVTANDSWTTSGFTIQNTTQLTGTSTFIITPAAERSVSASDFATMPTTSYYSSITFADSGTAAAADNTVIATINWITQSISSDLNITVDLSSIQSSYLPKTYESILEVFYDKSSGDNQNYLTNFDKVKTGSSWNSSTGTLTLNGGEGGSHNYGGQMNLWNVDSENGSVFTLTYTIDPGSTVNSGDLVLGNASTGYNGVINLNEITLNTTAGTHSVDITVRDYAAGQPANKIFFRNKSTDTSRDAIITSISLRRKNNTGESVTFSNINSGITISDDLIPSDTAKSRYQVSGLLEAFQTHNLFTARLSAHGAGYYSITPNMLLNSEAAINHDTSAPVLLYNTAGLVNGSEVTLKYYVEDHLTYEDNALTIFGNQSQTEETFVSFQVENFNVAYTGATYDISFIGTGNPPTFEVTSGSSWLAVESTANFNYFNNQYFDVDDQVLIGNGSVQITTQSQPGSGSQRSGTITVTSSGNNTGTPDDTITIIQLADGTTEFVELFHQGAGDGTYIINTGQHPNSLITQDPVLGDIIKKELFVSTSSATLTTSNVNVAVSTGDAGFLVIDSVEPSSTIGDFVINYHVTATDTSLFTRAATITVTYPGGTASDDQRVQQNIYDSSTNTISAESDADTPSANINFSYDTSDTSREIEITTSETGTPTPIFDISSVDTYYGPNTDELIYTTNQITGDFEFSDVQVVTGESYTHKITVTAQDYNGFIDNDFIPDGNVILFRAVVHIYHYLDYNFTNPAIMYINQFVNSSNTDPE